MTPCKVMVMGKRCASEAVAVVVVRDSGAIDPVTGNRRRGFTSEIPMCQACLDKMPAGFRAREAGAAS